MCIKDVACCQRQEAVFHSAIQVITLCQTVVFGDSWGATAIEPWLSCWIPIFFGFGENFEYKKTSSHSSSLLRSSSFDCD